MKQYLIDQLNPMDVSALRSYLDDAAAGGTVPGIYRLTLPDDLRSPIQRQHPDCAPFYLALELTDDHLACEFLVRAAGKMRCDCMGYADGPIRQWAMASVDAILERLDIRI